MISTSRRQFLSAAAASSLLPGVLRAQDSRAKPKIKVGQIGVEHAHASKLSVYRSSPDYEVVGIVEPNERLRKQATEQPAYRDLPWLTREQLLNTPGLQAVLVETHVRELLDNAELCIAAGKHVHLDKPAGADWLHYVRLLNAAEQKQLLVQMGYMYRYNPGVILLREFLKQGWLGDIFEVSTIMGKVVPPAERKELAEFSGGIMFELACHVIDLVIGVLGKPTAITPYPHTSGRFGDTLADNMQAVFSYPQATATVRSSANEVDGGERRQFTVCGTEGTFHIQPLDNPGARIALSQPRGESKKGYQTVAFPRFTRYVADAADMAQILRGEKASDFSYDHDRNVQEAVLRSSGMWT